jgi:hypothetical protein
VAEDVVLAQVPVHQAAVVEHAPHVPDNTRRDTHTFAYTRIRIHPREDPRVQVGWESQEGRCSHTSASHCDTSRMTPASPVCMYGVAACVRVCQQRRHAPAGTHVMQDQ